MIPASVQVKNGRLPDEPGVYLMHDAKGKLLYVGKAANLNRRVTSYFTRPHDSRIQAMVQQITRIEYEETGTAIEALIREAALIKDKMPPYNVKDKDNKSFLHVVITKEEFPRVLLVRGKDLREDAKEKIPVKEVFGPFTSASNIREALRIIRRLFPYSTHTSSQIHKGSRPCFDCQIGLCPGVCAGKISKKEYQKTIKHLLLFLHGKKARIVKALEKEMALASKKQEFEKATALRGKIFALQHIQDVALISDTEIVDPDAEKKATASGKVQKLYRIEGYDISNISGTSSVGSMVVFINGQPDKQEYRKFKIKTVTGPDDFAMMEEVLMRRFRNTWTLPDLVLVDGGKGQVSMAKRVVRQCNLKIPVIGLAKGPERKRNDIVGIAPSGISLATLIRVRDEAHRFAIGYHKVLRRAGMFQ